MCRCFCGDRNRRLGANPPLLCSGRALLFPRLLGDELCFTLAKKRSLSMRRCSRADRPGVHPPPAAASSCTGLRDFGRNGGGSRWQPQLSSCLMSTGGPWGGIGATSKASPSPTSAAVSRCARCSDATVMAGLVLPPDDRPLELPTPTPPMPRGLRLPTPKAVCSFVGAGTASRCPSAKRA